MGACAASANSYVDHVHLTDVERRLNLSNRKMIFRYAETAGPTLTVTEGG